MNNYLIRFFETAHGGWSAEIIPEASINRGLRTLIYRLPFSCAGIGKSKREALADLMENYNELKERG